jgi:hypothetical protein
MNGDIRNLSVDTIFGGISKDGTLQQYVVVDDEWVVEAPTNLSAVEAASLVTAGTTAWSAIRGGLDLGLDGVLGEWKGSWTDKRLQGKTVLTMGTGGVSCFALQVRIHPQYPYKSLMTTDCIRPRRDRHRNLIIHEQTRLCQIPRRNARYQLRPNPRLGARGPQAHSRQRCRPRHRDRRRGHTHEEHCIDTNGRSNHRAGHPDAKCADFRGTCTERVVRRKDW